MFKIKQTILFTSTIFLSAYLLFLIQPMVGKSLLPILGGTPSVWNTAMLFFQLLLLAGYLYAHLLGKLKAVKTQLLIHAVILVTAFATLPMAISFTDPDNSKSPLLWQIITMTGMIGLPFFALSTSAPLLQKWFSLSDHPNAHAPYFLYSASNIGSVLALVLYPVLVERFLPLPEQTIGFQIGFGLLSICLIACGLSLIKVTQSAPVNIADTSPTPDAKTLGIWAFLAFVPSSLMLGFTSFVTTDIGSTPLFWVMPLTLYILSFVFAFAHRKIFPLPTLKTAFIVLFLLINILLNLFLLNYKWEVAIVHGILFFVTALMCHQQLDALKPSTKHLTLFFLMMSIGGACGGIFNALIAPLIFLKPYEYMLASALALVCWGIGQNRKPMLLLGLFIMAINPVIPWETSQKKLVHISRNYFGTLTVRENDIVRSLAHGTTAHGSQSISLTEKLIPLTYYYRETGIGQTVQILQHEHPNVNAIGLGMGVGSISCLFRPADRLAFIEIDPDIIKIAQDPSLYTYIHDCGTPISIIQGDARLKLKEQKDGQLDYLLVDVFSGDNIPMHLMTTESAALYLQKLKPNGMLVFHISNRYMHLARELGLISKTLNINAYHKITPEGKIKGSNLIYFSTDVVVFTNNPTYQKKLTQTGWKLMDMKDSKLHPWTDTYANPLRALFASKNHKK